MSSRVFLAACALLVAACQLSRTDPHAQAAAVQAKCSSEATSDARVVDPHNVDRVEPLYAIVDSTPNGMESRLIGAKVHIRQLDGLTAEYVSNALYCHAASDTLRSTPSTTSPFAIPNAWVDIQVRPDPTGYEVAVRGQDFHEAEQILSRAKAFEGN
jgi:hypothetical protein